MTGLAIGVGAVIVLPLAAPILRPLAKTAIKGGIQAYRGTAELVEGIGDLVAEAAAEGGVPVAEASVEGQHRLPGSRGRGAVEISTAAESQTEETPVEASIEPTLPRERTVNKMQKAEDNSVEEAI